MKMRGSAPGQSAGVRAQSGAGIAKTADLRSASWLHHGSCALRSGKSNRLMESKHDGQVRAAVANKEKAKLKVRGNWICQNGWPKKAIEGEG
jgi:hypothetical protein